MNDAHEIVFIAAENGALPGGKVGGVGDVTRDLPRALARAGWTVTVLTPGYGSLSRLDGARTLGSIEVPFANALQRPEIVALPDHDGVAQRLIEHPLLAPDGPGRIYTDDGPERPFATDAGKFAFFCAAAAEFVASSPTPPTLLHLNDWHCGLLPALRAYDPRYRRLGHSRCVFTIHNMAMQGVRPLHGDPSSLAAWFPGHAFALEALVDPRYPDCVNPMAAAIRLADGLNTVSPTYAREIVQPNDPERGFHGGEGLEGDLHDAASDNRLHGILNGLEYPDDLPAPSWPQMLRAAATALDEWAGDDRRPTAVHTLARRRLDALGRQRPAMVLTSVGRLTEQKASLFLAGGRRCALERILDRLGDDGLLVLLGSGERRLEQRFGEIAAKRPNMLYLNGYSDSLSQAVYANGDLFLMPSSFEPCGISQMLAMRAGQPCVVHGVGGLADTVTDGVTGFVFAGLSVAEQSDRFVDAVERALLLKQRNAAQWQTMREAAAAKRFSWDRSAAAYAELLYADDAEQGYG